MRFLDYILETFITEAAALTKGSQRVMNDKNLVSGIADSLRDDAQAHPQNFPPNSKRTFLKAPDDELAQWFLENIDKIEKEGYEGTVYSRDGANSEWIARRYIAGSHNWEDLTGVMNMNLRDWYLLKNRNMLDPNHRDLPKFNGVRDVGYYMTSHYGDKLEKFRDAAKNASRNKMAKSVKLVDNDDYRIYTTLNRAAGCVLGLGTQWCTANSNYDSHFHSYSDKAMLFQMFPYTKEKDEEGKKILNDKEKYQFDAGTPAFMDMNDHVARRNVIREKYPYIYSDLASALKKKKPELEKAFADLSQDPSLQAADFKIKTYEIDEEIEKLGKFVKSGYFTTENRPAAVSSRQDAEQGSPEVIPASEQQPPQGTQQMESIDDLLDEMLDIKYEEEEADQSTATGGSIGSMGAGPSSGGKYPPGTAPTMPESIQGKNIMENVDKDVAAMLASLKKYDMLKESVSPVLGMVTLGEKKDGKPEWLEKAEKKAEKEEGKEIDEKWSGDTKLNPKKKGMFKGKTLADIESELSNLKKSGPHKEGSAEYTKMKELNFAKRAKQGWKEAEEVDDEMIDEADDTPWEKIASKDEDKEDVKESADPEVLEWMKRFSNLGNMKGYGR